MLLGRSSCQGALVYACSWWRAEDAEHLLKDAKKPIGKALNQRGMELMRDITHISYGHNEELERSASIKLESGLAMNVWGA